MRARKEWGQVVVDPLEAKRWLLPRARRRKLPSRSNKITFSGFCDYKYAYNPLLSRVKKRKGARSNDVYRLVVSHKSVTFGSSWRVEGESAARQRQLENLLPTFGCSLS